MSRKDLRLGIAQFFGGTTWDADAKIYRPTPLAACGLAGVYAYWPKEVGGPADSDYLATLPAGSTFGAVMGVHLESQDESRIAMGGITTGIKQDITNVELWIFHYSNPADQASAQAQLDDLIDAIKTRFHGDRTLGGACVQAGEGGSSIGTRTGLPVTTPAALVRQEAVITFQAALYPGV